MKAQYSSRMPGTVCPCTGAGGQRVLTVTCRLQSAAGQQQRQGMDQQREVIVACRRPVLARRSV